MNIPITDTQSFLTLWLPLSVTIGTIIYAIYKGVIILKEAIDVKREMKKEYMKGTKYLYHFTQSKGETILRKLKMEFKTNFLRTKIRVFIIDISADEKTHLKYSGFVKNESGQPLFLLETQKTDGGKAEKEEIQIRFASFADFNEKIAYGVWMGKDFDENPVCGIRLYSQVELPDAEVEQRIHSRSHKKNIPSEKCIAMLNIMSKSIPEVPDQRVRVLLGKWHVYHFTRKDDQTILRHDQWEIETDLLNTLTIKTKDHDIPEVEYIGSVSFERNYILITLKGISHDEEGQMRFFDIIPSDEAKTFGLWMGIDFNIKPISSVRLMSKKELDTECARNLIKSRTLIYENLILSVNDNSGQYPFNTANNFQNQINTLSNVQDSGDTLNSDSEEKKTPIL